MNVAGNTLRKCREVGSHSEVAGDSSVQTGSAEGTKKGFRTPKGHRTIFFRENILEQS